MTVFLAPADPSNAKRSLQAPVDLDAFRRAIGNPERFNRIAAALGGLERIYCWAARDSKLGIIRRMSPGDEVYFGLTGSGRFDLRGIVVTTFESPRFVQVFWSDKRLQGWRGVYVLRDVETVAIDKVWLRKCLGYDPNDRFQGLRTIPAERMGGFASLTALLAAQGPPRERMPLSAADS